MNDLQQKFVIYCRELEVKFAKKHHFELEEKEMRINGLHNEILRIKEEHKFGKHVIECIEIKKLKLKKTTLQS